jgi:hypothetical protein
MALCYHWRWKDAKPNGQTRTRQFHYSDLCLGTAAAAAPLVVVGQRRGAGAVHLGERRRVAVACTDGLVGTAAAVTKALGWHWSVLRMTQISFYLLLTRGICAAAAVVRRAGSSGMVLHVYFGFRILLSTGTSMCRRSSIDRDGRLATCIRICG